MLNALKEGSTGLWENMSQLIWNAGWNGAKEAPQRERPGEARYLRVTVNNKKMNTFFFFKNVLPYFNFLFEED